MDPKHDPVRRRRHNWRAVEQEGGVAWQASGEEAAELCVLSASSPGTSAAGTRQRAAWRRATSPLKVRQRPTSDLPRRPSAGTSGADLPRRQLWAPGKNNRSNLLGVTIWGAEFEALYACVHHEINLCRRMLLQP